MEQATSTDRLKEIRTYFPYSLPVDPASVITTPDLDLSYALASTLVDWDDSKQIQSAVCSRWHAVNDRTYRFEIGEKARWSNGERMTCQQVKLSLDRAKRVHGKNLSALFDRLASVSCPDAKTIELRMATPISDIGLLAKLTEPMYGILKINQAGEPDLSVSSGPFFLEHSSANELILRRNPYWIHFSPGIPERVILRKPPHGIDDQTVLLKDPWPNLAASHSLMSPASVGKYEKEHFAIWQRNLDRVFLLTFLGRKTISEDQRKLFQVLGERIDRSMISHDLYGLEFDNQLFARGYPLYVPGFQFPKAGTELPAQYRSRRIRILISPERVPERLRNNLTVAIEQITGSPPEFVLSPVNELANHAEKLDFDFYAGSIGVSDPNFDGTLAYVIQADPVIIPSGKGDQDFRHRLAEARKNPVEAKRIPAIRSLLIDAISQGYVLPLFHFSTGVIARAGIDLSKIPTSDETISFSKIRFLSNEARTQ